MKIHEKEREKFRTAVKGVLKIKNFEIDRFEVNMRIFQIHGNS